MLGPLELYPVHILPELAPEGQRMLVEPQTYKVQVEYLVVQQSREAYAMPQEYTKRLWIC